MKLFRSKGWFELTSHAVFGGHLVCALLYATSAQPPPSGEEQAAVIEAARAGALTFTEHLPDFICTQVTRRWMNRGGSSSDLVVPSPRYRMPSKTIRLDQRDDWKLRDTLTVQVTYLGQKEQYKLLLINGQKTNRTYESAGGAIYYGDFGSILGILFQTSSQAKFVWDHWGSLNNQPVMVFSFNVDVQHSQWHIGYENQQVVTAFKGLVYIEPKQPQVLKLKAGADEIPKKFPIQRSGVELDYRLTTVGDQEFLLPLKAVDWSDTKSVSSRNEAEFRLYRKFTADSKINFDTPDPLPENQTKETVPNSQ